jgi:hypothetical protein
MIIRASGLKLILTIFNLKIKVISHNIWHKTTNNLISWSNSYRALCTYCVVPPACVQLCNPHNTPLYYLKSPNILKSLSKELEQMTSHYTTKVLYSPLHTHTHTHNWTLRLQMRKERTYPFINTTELYNY